MSTRNVLWAFGVVLISAVPAAMAADCTCVGNRSDDFSDGILDASWAVSGSCGTVSEVGGELLLNKSSCNGTIGIAMNPNVVTICGDFDVQVDFRLVSFTANGYGRYASLYVADVSNGANKAVIERYAESPPYCRAPSTQAYKAWVNISDNCDTSPQWQSTTDTSGRFRIQREGAQITLYYWSGSWVSLKSRAWVAGDVKLGMYTGTTPLTGTASQVYFDNLTITSQECPTGVRPLSANSTRLLQNYPNPFSPGTNIVVTVPTGGAPVDIEVTDILGRRVRTLLNGWSEGGLRSIPWDGTNDAGQRVASGVYFCRLHGKTTDQVRRLVLLR